MARIASVLAIAGLIAVGGAVSVNAQPGNSFGDPRARTAWPESGVPRSAFYLGLGGSYNTANFGTQNVYAVGTSEVFQAGVLSSTGSAAGPANVFIGSESNFAFSLQGGYFQRFSGSDWLWGAKFAYTYLGATVAMRNVLLPQAGSFTATGSVTPVPFTGNAVVGSYQANIIHQMALIPFLGRAFEKSFVYLGAGPTLSQVRTNLNGLVGFADINGATTDVSGMPIDLSSTSWVFGGAAVVGATYFFDPYWFLDFNYTFAMTSNQTAYFYSPFTNPNGSNGSTVVGTLVGNSTGKVVTQGITVTLNRAF